MLIIDQAGSIRGGGGGGGGGGGVTCKGASPKLPYNFKLVNCPRLLEMVVHFMHTLGSYHARLLSHARLVHTRLIYHARGISR